MLGKPHSQALSRAPIILGGLLLAALTLSENSATRFYTWPWFLYGQILLMLPPAALTVRLFGSTPFSKFGGWMDAGLISFALTSLVSALLSSRAWVSLNLTLPYLSAIATTYLALNWLRSGQREEKLNYLQNGLGIFFSLLVATSLLQWLFLSVLPSWQQGGPIGEALSIRNEHPFGHSNYVAGAAILIIPWLAALAWWRRGMTRIIWLAFAGLATGLLISTGSRGGLLGFLILLVCAAGWIWRSRLLSPRQYLLAAILAGGAAMVIVMLNPRIRDLLIHHSWSDLARESNRQRSAMQDAGLKMGVDRPLLGQGPGAIPLIYPSLRAQLSGGVENVLQLHSTPVQIWAELGSAGIICMLFILLGLVKQFRRRVKVEVTIKALPVEVVAFTTLAAYGVMAFTDHQLDVPFFSMAVAVFLAIACTTGDSSDASPVVVSRKYRLLAAISLVIGVIILIGASLPNARARSRFSKALDELDAGNPKAFITLTEEAADIAPWETFYFNQLAAHFIEQCFKTNDAAEKKLSTENAVRYLQASLARDSNQEYAHFNLGWLLLDLGQPEAASHYRAAAQLVPDKGGVYFGLGLSLYQQNRMTEAIHAFATEWINNPSAITAPLWDTPPFSTLRPAVLSDAVEQYKTLLGKTAQNPGLHQQVVYAEALTRWLCQDHKDLHTLVTMGRPEQSAFFQALEEMEHGRFQNSPDTSPWNQLHACWQSHTIAPLASLPQYSSEARFLNAIEQHSRKTSGSSFTEFLIGSVADEPNLQVFYRRHRAGYGVLMRQNEGLPLIDFYYVNENRLIKEFASFIFPAKGWLPPRYLLPLLTPTTP